MNRKLGVKGLCCEETLVGEGVTSDYQMAFARYGFLCIHFAPTCKSTHSNLEITLSIFIFACAVFCPITLLHPPQPPFARFLIILVQAAVGRWRWPSAWLHIAPWQAQQHGLLPWHLTVSFPSPPLPPTGFITWYWRDMELKEKKIYL